MPAFSKKGISMLAVAAIVVLTIGMAIIPEIIGEDMKVWCQQNLGPNYKGWFLGSFVVGSAILFYLTDSGKSLFSPSKKQDEQTSLTLTELETYRTGIRQWLKSRYELRLDQKMAGRLPINLSRLASTEGTSEFRAETFEEISEEQIQGKLTELFHEAKGRLLILGVPGAGKTTLMLQLALGLLDSEPDAVPVVVNLATWSMWEFKTLEDWLRKTLPIELGVNTTLATKVLAESHLILLFDGLDEIIYELERATCLTAIGAFGANAKREYAISSRKKEYLAATKDAPVRFQIEVGPLQIGQIEVELAQRDHHQPEDRLLLNALRKDKYLREAAETPFYFNCIQLLFSRGLTPDDLRFWSENREGREAEILDRFIEQQLKNCQKPKAKYWLSFLASGMEETSRYNPELGGYFGNRLVYFELQDLQYDWWKKWGRKELFFAGLMAGLILVPHFGLLFGLFGGLLGGLIEGPLLAWLFVGPLVGMLSFGLFWGLIGSLILSRNKLSPKIETKGSIRWSWKYSSRSLKKIIVFGLLVGLLVGLLGRLLYGRGFGLLNGLLGGLFFVLFSVLNDFLEHSHTSSLKFSTPYQRFTTSMKSLNFSILQHLLLRYQLARKGLLPLRLVYFLNEMASYQSEKEMLQGKPKPRRFTTSDVHLLESDGATWRFRHRLIQEWFVGKWEED